jgi:TatD DNase family protein
MIDTHTHLNFPELASQLEAVLERAKDVGVDTFVVPATDLETSLSSVKLAGTYGSIFACIGIHPCSAQEYSAQAENTFHALLSDHTNVTSIGEVGLDYYHFETLTTADDIDAAKENQKKVFTRMLELAREYSLPAIIHSREAYADTKEILSRHTDLRAVIHCFTGTQEQASGWLEQGLMVSLTGIITYKKNSDLRDVVRVIPLDRIMVETDSPYLSPEGYRKEVCEPRFVRNVAECIAEIKGISFEEVDSVTTENARQFFKI